MASWIQASDVAAFLNKNNVTTSDTNLIQGFTDSACRVVERAKGHVDPSGFVETHTVGARMGLVVLDERPVLSVDVVTDADTGVALTDVTDPAEAAGVTGPTFVQTSPGVLAVSSGCRVTVRYTAGLNPIPPEYLTAVRELVLNSWRATQTSGGGGRPMVPTPDQMIVPGLTSALPYRVRELLGLFGKVVDDSVLIA